VAGCGCGQERASLDAYGPILLDLQHWIKLAPIPQRPVQGVETWFPSEIEDPDKLILVPKFFGTADLGESRSRWRGGRRPAHLPHRASLFSIMGK
jgi:hypothetical protein